MPISQVLHAAHIRFPAVNSFISPFDTSIIFATGDGNNTLLQQPLHTTLWPQRQADLLPLYIAATDSSSNSAETLQAHAALSAALAERVGVDKAVRAAVASLLAEPQVQAMIQVGAD